MQYLFCSGEKEDENGNTFLEISINTAADCSIHQRYYRLHVLDFDSDRKCMSVIMREENGGIFLFSKGAESSIFPKCHQNQVLVNEMADFLY
jgi:magnesium-transporting ATPase (P-type)